MKRLQNLLNWIYKKLYKKKMIENFEKDSVFKQADSLGLNKDEILFIYDLISKDNEFLKKNIAQGAAIKTVMNTLDKLKTSTETKLEGYFEKVNENIVKLEKEELITSNIIKKLQPLKEIFE